MKFEFKPSFDRSIKSFPHREKAELKSLAAELVEMLSRGRVVPKGIGLKRLRENFWEARRGLKRRILFRWNGESVEFILAGNHDDVKRFLKEW
jgi:mRNA-degrading endonuclease RelE of RelBE toxin-antitoxin system